jgi:hypothetical protein
LFGGWYIENYLVNKIASDFLECYLDHYKEFGKLCQKGGDDEKN